MLYLGHFNCVFNRFIVIMTIIICLKIVDNFAADPTDISRLRQDLLQGYDKNARPIINHKNTTTLQINPYYRAFELDERRGIFTLHCWTIMVWNDDHFKWDPRSYGNLTTIHFGAEEVWKPDLSVYNNVDQSEIDHFGNTRLVAYNTGRIVWVPPTKFQIACNLDIQKWPYDSQTCSAILGSWAHDGTMLDLVLPTNLTELNLGEVVQNREWELVSTQATRRSYYYGDIPYPSILIKINIKRRPATHTSAVVVPALAISTAILIAFWIQPRASERLALILLVIIINALYLNNIYIAIPNNGDQVPLVLLFYRDSLIMVSIALVWTICLRYLAETKRTSPVPLPSFIISFLNSIPAKILCLDPRPVQGSSSGGGSEADDDGKLVSNSNPHQADWAWLAHLLDRIAFMIYLIVYICFYVALL